MMSDPLTAQLDAWTSEIVASRLEEIARSFDAQADLLFTGREIAAEMRARATDARSPINPGRTDQ